MGSSAVAVMGAAVLECPHPQSKVPARQEIARNAAVERLIIGRYLMALSFLNGMGPKSWMARAKPLISGTLGRSLLCGALRRGYGVSLLAGQTRGTLAGLAPTSSAKARVLPCLAPTRVSCVALDKVLRTSARGTIRFRRRDQRERVLRSWAVNGIERALFSSVHFPRKIEARNRCAHSAILDVAILRTEETSSRKVSLPSTDITTFDEEPVFFADSRKRAF